jgi:serine/threonine-protein kinase RsbT
VKLVTQEIKSVPIQNRGDIVESRMQVRTVAREAGLDPLDQARISLATSTMAAILGLEDATGSEITIGYQQNNGRPGVRVTCIRKSALLHDLAWSVLDDARRMVDDLQVETSADSGIKVTLVKWGSRRIHQNHRAGDLVSGNV